MKQTPAQSLFDPDLLKQGALLFRAVNHPLRQSLLHLLHKRGRLSVTAIYKKSKLGQSITSQHLAILRGAGVVNRERDGRQIYYSVNYGRLDQLQKVALKLSPWFE